MQHAPKRCDAKEVTATAPAAPLGELVEGRTKQTG